MKDKMYILVNEDIKLSKGKLAGQVGHAITSYMFRIMTNVRLGKGHKDYERFSVYMEEQKKIILKCPEEKLLELEAQRIYNVIRDKGLTHLKPGTLTCVNIGLHNDETIPEWIKKLKLY